MAEGIIMKALSGFYYVDDGKEIVTCRGRGKLRRDKVTPLVGDRVRFTPTENGAGALEEILPRRNEFYRPAVANIDQLVIIASQANPITDPFLIDRVAAIAADRNCRCIICINKWDLVPGEDLAAIYEAAGFPTIRMSAETGEGIEELRRMISGKISAFTGNSGVGKSSILNALEPDFALKVGEVSTALGRGRHTTRHVELFRLSCGAEIMDTPGFSSFDTDQMDVILKENLQYAFPDFGPFVGKCQFHDCSHRREPGCAVTEAVREGLICKSRYDSYMKLYEKASQIKEWEIK